MDYYKLLGIERDATIREIKKAYRRAAFRCHPDRNPRERKEESEREFKKISEAYQVLSDPIQRRIYDCSGKTDDFIDFVAAKDLFKELFPNMSGDISDESWEIIDGIFNDIENGKSFMDIAKGLPYLKILKKQLPNFIDIIREYFSDYTTKPMKKNELKPVVILNRFSLETLHERDRIEIKYPLLRYDGSGNAVMNEETIIIDNYLTKKRVDLVDNGHEYEPGKFSGLILYNEVIPHERFKRKNAYDLYVVQKINITDLVMCKNLYFKWIDGSSLEIPLTQTLLNLPVICLRNWGLKYLGDLYIHFQICHIKTTDYNLLQKIQPASVVDYSGDRDELHVDIKYDRVRLMFDDRA